MLTNFPSGSYLGLAAAFVLLVGAGAAFWGIRTALTKERMVLHVIAGTALLFFGWKVGETSLDVLDAWKTPSMPIIDLNGYTVGYEGAVPDGRTMDRLELLIYGLALLGVLAFISRDKVVAAASVFIWLGNFANYAAALTLYGASGLPLYDSGAAGIITTLVANGVMWLLSGVVFVMLVWFLLAENWSRGKRLLVRLRSFRLRRRAPMEDAYGPDNNWGDDDPRPDEVADALPHGNGQH